MLNLSPDVLALRAEMIAFRRDLHQHPELAYAETRTAARVAAFLGGSGVEVRRGVGGTGLLASAEGGRGRAVLRRAGLHALPLQAHAAAPDASAAPGRVHPSRRRR